MKRYWLNLIARFEREAGIRPAYAAPIIGYATTNAVAGEVVRVAVGAPNRMTAS